MYANYNMIQQSKLLNTNIIEQFGTLTQKNVIIHFGTKILATNCNLNVEAQQLHKYICTSIGLTTSKHSQEILLEFPMKLSRKT